MRVVHRMWSTICDVFPANTLRECAESLLANLMKNENMLIRGTGTTTLVADDEGIEQARTAWVALCVDVLLLCDADTMKMFWACEEDMAAAVAAGRHYPDWSHHWTNAVWKTCSEKWIEGEGTYEGAIVLLGVPFTCDFYVLARTQFLIVFIVAIAIRGAWEAKTMLSGNRYFTVPLVKLSTSDWTLP